MKLSDAWLLPKEQVTCARSNEIGMRLMRIHHRPVTTVLYPHNRPSALNLLFPGSSFRPLPLKIIIIM